jgi:hypothetical protein
MTVYSWPWLLTAIGLVILVIVGGVVATFRWAEEDTKYAIVIGLCCTAAAFAMFGTIFLIVAGFVYGLSGG